jgi:hypothetical protein
MTKFPKKYGACGDPNHVWSTCKAHDPDVLRWTLAKRKQIAEQYAGQPPPTAHISDVHAGSDPWEDAADCPLEYDMEDENDDTAVNISFASVAFASYASSVAYLSHYWVVDFACSVNLTACRYDFSEFLPPVDEALSVG